LRAKKGWVNLDDPSILRSIYATSIEELEPGIEELKRHNLVLERLTPTGRIITLLEFAEV